MLGDQGRTTNGPKGVAATLHQRDKPLTHEEEVIGKTRCRHKFDPRGRQLFQLWDHGGYIL